MNWKSKIAIVVYIFILIGALVSINIRIFSDNKMDVLYIAILDAAILGLPLFMTAGIFSAYRAAYLLQHKDRAEHVAWSNYMAQMALFILVVTIVEIFLLRYDSKASVYFAAKETASTSKSVLPSLVLGRSSIPLYFAVGGNYESVRIPTAMFWVAMLGAFVSILGTIMRRFVIEHLVARTYLHSTTQILYAMIASAIFFIAAQAWPEVLGQENSDPIARRNLLLLFAFFSGMFPYAIFHWVTRQLREKLNLGGKASLSLVEIQGIEPEIESFLYEEGIWSINDLASRKPRLLAKNIHLSEGLVTHWRDQARLITELGERELVERFRKLGINDWNNLEVLSGVDTNIELDHLTKAPGEPNEISPVLISVLKLKYEASKAKNS